MKIVWMKRKPLRVALLGVCFGFYGMPVCAAVGRVDPAYVHEYDFATYIEEKYAQFEQTVDTFNSLVEECFDNTSTEPLLVTCKRFKKTEQEILKNFINPLRQEFNKLIVKGQHHTVKYKCVELLLQMIDEMEQNFNGVYKALMSALQAKKYSSALVIKTVKPAVDKVTSDANFKKLDGYLVKLKHLVKSHNPAVAKDMEKMRGLLEKIRKECRSKKTDNMAILAMFRKRGPKGR